MNRLRELRQAQGLSKEQLAIEVGVAKETIDRWERGVYDIPIQHARALAKRFSVSLSWLLRDEHEGIAA